MVSTVSEKVWYCTVKGYTPWVNPKPGDKRTREEGGHTIWYDEPQLLKASQHSQVLNQHSVPGRRLPADSIKEPQLCPDMNKAHRDRDRFCLGGR